MIGLLASGGFVIRQWASNDHSTLDNISRSIIELDCGVKESSAQKTLGIVWSTKEDHFAYKVGSLDFRSVITKRKFLSEISEIYDSLGLLGPVILYAKVLMQECWKSGIAWDEQLPQDLQSKWLAVSEQFPILQEFSVPRRLIEGDPVEIEIHGFCDACDTGYGACLYVRSVDSRGVVTIRILCSKSRVAPLKKLTTPRLELCAASVLKKLFVAVKPSLGFTIKQVIFWSDSTIVLHWLRKAPHLLRPYESNRVADIQSLGDQVQWRHVRSKENPADALSRGQLPNDFVENELWLDGPKWLSLPEEQWPQGPSSLPLELSGFKDNQQDVCLLSINSKATLDNWWMAMYSRFSSFQRFTRVAAYILHWRQKTTSKKPTQLLPGITEDKVRIAGLLPMIRDLQRSEVEEAELRILKRLQQEMFSREIRLMQTYNSPTQGKISVPLHKPTGLDKLNPFLDQKDLIRVGGRLKNSDLDYNQRHPILLPSVHHLTEVIIREVHNSNMHLGILSTLYAIQDKIWIVNEKNQVNKIVHRCVKCIRQRRKDRHAQMADLPVSRVTEAPAFGRTGVDFFGPIHIKEKKDRNKNFLKVYGCVFVCTASKAVHIELATDLSTKGFLAAFRRFIRRRGIPSDVYSDNGTNFVGANRELSEVYDLHKGDAFRKDIKSFALSKRIDWHFHPPHSPHFGGLWEAAVKSFKHHLKRVMPDDSFTYEQINTLLIEIEAILNSRPLYTLSTDPNDLLAITPAHLLIGRPLNVLPESDLISVANNRLTGYKLIKKARQDFWRKWHSEYLKELQKHQE